MSSEAVASLFGLLATMFASAFFSASETAVFNLSDGDLAGIDARHPRAGAAMRAVRARGLDALVTILFANLLVNLTMFNFGHVVAVEVGRIYGTLAGTMVDVLVVFLAITISEIVPKAVAVNATAFVATWTAVPLVVVEKILRIPRAPFSHVAKLLSDLFVRERDEGDVTPDDLGRALGAAARRGEFGADEHEWLRALLDLDQAPVREVMTPRVDVVAFDIRKDLVAFEALHLSTFRNKIPVHEGSVDRIVGMLVVAEVLSNPDKPLASLVRRVPFVPESATVAEALEALRESKSRLAVVVDEYGGTEGIVTLEDVIEGVVGDLADEGEARWEPVVENPDGTWLVDAALPIHPARRIFGLPPEGGVATMGGLVVARLGRVAKPGDEITAGDVVMRVVDVKGRRPDRLHLRLRTARGGRS